MERLSRVGWLTFLLALTVSGCGRQLILPPTPARDRNLVCPDEPAPGERYFVTIFGSQSRPKRPCYTHTWATVVRVVEGECGPQLAEQYTLSWLPATLLVRPTALRPEPGINLGLHETFVYVLGHREKVLQWGPYECRPWVFERVKRQAAFLESGTIGYQCADGVGEARRGTGCNCVHALTDVDPDCDRACYPLRRFGHSGSINAVQGFAERGAFLDPEMTHHWLNALLGVEAYPIECRPFPGPGRSRPMWDWLRGCKRKLTDRRPERADKTLASAGGH